MNNLNYFFPPASASPTLTEQDQTPGQAQVFSETTQNQPASFADMATSVNPLGQAQVPVPPPISDSELMPPRRQLSTLNVSAHTAPQHSPQLNLPQSDLPPIDPFKVLSSYQPIQFDDDIQLESLDDLIPIENVDELVRVELREVYVPVQPGGDISGPIRTVTTNTPQNTINTSITEHFVKSLTGTGTSTSQDARIASNDQHFGQSLSGTSETSQQRRRSTRKRTATETTTQIKKKSRACSATSTDPSAEPATVPASVPVTVRSEVSSATNQSALEEVPDSTDKWIIVAPTRKRPFRCGYPKCNKSYKQKRYLKTHLLKHGGKSNFECTYPECIGKKYFRDSEMLNRHIHTKHTFEKPFPCGYCKQRFRRKDQCKVHRNMCILSLMNIGDKKN